MASAPSTGHLPTRSLMPLTKVWAAAIGACAWTMGSIAIGTFVRVSVRAGWICATEDNLPYGNETIRETVPV